MTRSKIRRRILKVSPTIAIYASCAACMMLGAILATIGIVGLTTYYAGTYPAVAVFGGFLIAYGYVGYRIGAEVDGRM